MAMGRSDAVQDDLMATWAEMPRSPGHAFYDRLQDLLREAGFEAFVEGVWRPGGAQSGLRQSHAAEIGYRARDHAPARRVGLALLRSYPRSPRHAPRLAARTGEPPQALSDPCRRVQSRRPDARPLGSRDAEGGSGGRIRPDFSSPIRRGAGLRSNRHRTANSPQSSSSPQTLHGTEKPGLRQRAANFTVS